MRSRTVLDNRALAALILVLLVAVSYSNSLFNPFMWDDKLLILHNQGIRKGWESVATSFNPALWGGGRIDNDAFRAFYRPMHTLLNIIDYQVWGLNPFGYHLSNTVLHLFNTLVLYLFSIRLLGDMRASFLAGAIFAVHPVHTESVTFISARVDLLAMSFMLTSFYLFMGHGRETKEGTSRLLSGAYLVSLFLFLLALLSKEMALTLPVLLAVYSVLFEERGARAIRVMPYFLVLILYVLFRIFGIEMFVAQHQMRADLLTLASTVSAVVLEYARLLVFPYPLKAFYSLHWYGPASPRAVLGLVLLSASLALLAFLLFRRKKALAFMLIWTFLSLAPVLNIGALGEFSMAERYLYIPSIGFSVLSGAFLSRLSSTGSLRKIMPYVIVAMFIVLSALTIHRNRIWGDDIGFYKAMAEGAPDSAMPHANLAHAYDRENNVAMAISEMEKASALVPGNHAIRLELAAYYIKARRFEDAVRELSAAVELKPDFVDGYNLLGIANAELGRTDLAERAFLTALSINPASEAAALNLAKIRALKGGLTR